MKYTVPQIKSLYNEIDFVKIKDADIATELKGIQERTADFGKDYIIEIEADNFADLYDLVKELYPAAISLAKVKAPKKKEESKPAKTLATKKVAVKKDKPAAKPVNKKAKSLEELSAEDKYFEECKMTIRDRNQVKKAAKLAEYKTEKINLLEAKGEVVAAEREAIEKMSYSEAFAKKKSVTMEVTDSMFSIFEKVVKTHYHHMVSNAEIAPVDKSNRFKQSNVKVVEMFADKFLPELHKSLTGAKATSYIENFWKKGEKCIAEFAERLDKKIAKKEMKEAA